MEHPSETWSYHAPIPEQGIRHFMVVNPQQDIAEVYGFEDEGEAHARLISAAPELLQQLKALTRWAEDHGEDCPLAQAAIAKAMGWAEIRIAYRSRHPLELVVESQQGERPATSVSGFPSQGQGGATKVIPPCRQESGKTTSFNP